MPDPHHPAVFPLHVSDLSALIGFREHGCWEEGDKGQADKVSSGKTRKLSKGWVAGGNPVAAINSDDAGADIVEDLLVELIQPVKLDKGTGESFFGAA